MKQALHRTFLDTLLSTTQQQLSSSLFGLDTPRNVGAHMHARGDYGKGDEFIGTDQDDTVLIDGNLTGGPTIDIPTNINLLNGNNVMTVGKKLIVNSGEFISISAEGDDNTLNIGGINGYITHFTSDTHNSDYGQIHIVLNGTSSNTINIAEDVIMGKPKEEIENSSYSVYGLNISLGNYNDPTSINSLVLNNFYSDFVFHKIQMYGKENTLTVNQNIIFDNGSNLDIHSNGNLIIHVEKNIDLLYESDVSITHNLNNSIKESRLDFCVNGELREAQHSFIGIQPFSKYSNFSFGTVFLDNSGFAILNEGEDYNAINSTLNFIVNNDFVLLNHSPFEFSSHAKIESFEIGGVVKCNNGSQFLSGGSDDNDTISFLGGIINNSSYMNWQTHYGNDDVYVEKAIQCENTLGETYLGRIFFELDKGDDKFTLNGDMIAFNNGSITIAGGDGNDIISIAGSISVDTGGRNSITGDSGDDIIHLNGHVGIGALGISGGEGNDTLILTAASQSRLESEYKDWLTDLSSSGLLGKSEIENIKLDVRNLQVGKLGWLNDIINKANSEGAHITLEDNNGNILSNPKTYLSQTNEAHNPIIDILDNYAPVTSKTVLSDAFKSTTTERPSETFAAANIPAHNFLNELEQQAQIQAASAA